MGTLPVDSGPHPAWNESGHVPLEACHFPHLSFLERISKQLK